MWTAFVAVEINVDKVITNEVVKYVDRIVIQVQAILLLHSCM